MQFSQKTPIASVQPTATYTHLLRGVMERRAAAGAENIQPGTAAFLLAADRLRRGEG